MSIAITCHNTAFGTGFGFALCLSARSTRISDAG